MPGYNIMLGVCTKNYNQMIYGSWDTVHDRQTEGQTNGQKKWHTEVGAPPKNKMVRYISSQVCLIKKFFKAI